jgi:hypothetical protein
MRPERRFFASVATRRRRREYGSSPRAASENAGFGGKAAYAVCPASSMRLIPSVQSKGSEE